MPVNFEHPDFIKMSDKWKRCIDVCKGEDTIHTEAEKYLPRLTEQSDKEYAAYKCRAGFYNATWRTLVGLQGMLFRKPPQLTVPALVEPMLDNIDMSGTSLHMFALTIAEECLKVGRVGVFVDFPMVEVGVTAADAVKRNLRPSMKMYTALSIINWKTANINNANVLSMVVLKECVDVPKDEFESTEQTQYRVLDLVMAPPSVTGQDSDGSFIYRVRVFVIDKDGNDQLVGEPVFPKVNSKNLDYIPFQFMSVDDTSPVVDEPPLIDLVDMNISHYRVSADWEHGCHFTGLPTPVISGYQSQGEVAEKFCIGSTTAWVFPNPTAKASYLEFTGQGLQALRDNLDKKESLMAILGARMLENTVKSVESANTAAINRGGEQSMLSSVAQVISIGMRKCLETFCKFANATGEVTYGLNRDFFPMPMDALKLTAIIAGWQNQAYSYESMFELFKQGEIVPTDANADEEQKAIKSNPPPMPEGADKNGAPTTPGDVKKKAPKTKATPATPAPTIKQLQNKGGQN